MKLVRIGERPGEQWSAAYGAAYLHLGDFQSLERFQQTLKMMHRVKLPPTNFMKYAIFSVC